MDIVEEKKGRVRFIKGVTLGISILGCRFIIILLYLSQLLHMYHFFSCPAQGTTVKNLMKTGAYSTLLSDFQFLSTARKNIQI